MVSLTKARAEGTRQFAAAPERVWAILSDTDRMNQAIGLPPVLYDAITDRGARVCRKARFLGGLAGSLCWRDFPYEWVRGQGFRVYREFESRILRDWITEAKLEPVGTGTRVTMRLEIGARLGPLMTVLRWILERSLRRIFRHVERMLAAAVVPDATSAVRRADPRLAQRLSRFPVLFEKGNRAAENLRMHLLLAADSDASRMRPFALADLWKTNREQTLRVFLQATAQGLLEMNWELLCPNCRVPKAEFRSLQQLTPNVHCEYCELDFEARLDEFIELRFTVARGVRPVTDAIYCIGAPGRTPHILAQGVLEPGEAREIRLDAPAESLRLRVVRSGQALLLRPDTKGPSHAEARFSDGQLGADTAIFHPGALSIRWRNLSPRPATFALECYAWDSTAVTAAYVTSLHEFRQLFALEVLPPGRFVGVKSICLLFSDLKDSTRLYESIGDAPAFTRVQKHFEFMNRVIAEHRGAVVKTMGDAVMAVFSDPVDAVRAALSMQSEIGAFSESRGISPALVLKIGLHCGPAISFNAEGVLDFFGRTVNLAARVQSQSGGGDVVLSQSMLDAPGVRAALAEVGGATAFQSRLKGIEGEQALYRVGVSAGKVKAAA